MISHQSVTVSLESTDRLLVTYHPDDRSVSLHTGYTTAGHDVVLQLQAEHVESLLRAVSLLREGGSPEGRDAGSQ